MGAKWSVKDLPPALPIYFRGKATLGVLAKVAIAASFDVVEGYNNAHVDTQRVETYKQHSALQEY